MPRIRTIKPGFFKDEDLAEHDPLTRILFAGLWTTADGEGRQEDRPRFIKAEVLPYDDCDVEEMLAALARPKPGAPFIVRYQVDGIRYIAIPGWKEHQRINGKEAETPSEIPPPPVDGKQSGSNGEAVNVQEGKGKEGKGIGKEDASLESPLALQVDPPKSVLEFPVVGKPTRLLGGGAWVLDEKKLTEYVESYPGINVMEELRRALQWLRDRPNRRKTPRGMPAFLSSWLGRAQNWSRERRTDAGQRNGFAAPTGEPRSRIIDN